MFNDPDDPLIQPEVIPLHAAAPDPILLATPATLFVDRAARFETFAARRDAQQPFFAFMAHLSRAQHVVASTFVPHGLPDAAMLAVRYAHRMPVLPGGLAERDPSWLVALRAVIAASEAGEGP